MLRQRTFRFAGTAWMAALLAFAPAAAQAQHGHRGGREHFHGGGHFNHDRGGDHRRGGGNFIGGALLGLGVGALVGGLAAQQPYYPPPPAYYPPPPPAYYAPPPVAYYPN